MVEDRVGVIAIVGEHGFGLSVTEQRDGPRAIVRLVAVSTKPRGDPSSLASRWILVVRPSRFRSRAVSGDHFFASTQPAVEREVRWNRS
jgi:hypothetical protein